MKTPRLLSLAALICALNAPVYATGIPVVDGAQIARTIEQTRQQLDVWLRQKTIMNRHHEDQLTNSKRGSFQNKLPDVKLPQWDEKRYLQLIDKETKDCDRLGNPDSKKVCKDLLEIERSKVKLYGQYLRDLNKSLDTLKSRIREHGNSRGDRQAGRQATIENTIAAAQRQISIKQQLFDQTLKGLEMQKEILQKHRDRLSQEQINGKGQMLRSTLVKAGVAAALTRAASKERNKAKALREENANTSRFYTDGPQQPAPKR